MTRNTSRRQMILAGMASVATLGNQQSFAQVNSTPFVDITLVDPKNGNRILERGICLVRVKDKTIQKFNFQNGKIRFHNNATAPIEVHIITRKRHVANLQRLAPKQDMKLSIVLWPPRGPETLDRVLEQLQVYERLFSQYAQSPRDFEREIWFDLWNQTAELLIQMRRPDFITASAQQNDFVTDKLEDVHQMYQIQQNVIVQKPVGHCSCNRRRCCWCGNLK